MELPPVQFLANDRLHDVDGAFTYPGARPGGLVYTPTIGQAD